MQKEKKIIVDLIAYFHEKYPNNQSTVSDSDDPADTLRPKLGKTLYLCREWYTRWKCSTYPGKINHSKYECTHGKIKPEFRDDADIERNFITIPGNVWKDLVLKYGGGPRIVDQSFDECTECKEEEALLLARRSEERKQINQLDRTYITAGEVWYIITDKWLKQWMDFARSDGPQPGPIDNSILLMTNGEPKAKLKVSIHYRGVVKEVWDYFHQHYGGGPIITRPVIDIYASHQTSHSNHHPIASTNPKAVRGRGSAPSRHPPTPESTTSPPSRTSTASSSSSSSYVKKAQEPSNKPQGSRFLNGNPTKHKEHADDGMDLELVKMDASVGRGKPSKSNGHRQGSTRLYKKGSAAERDSMEEE